MKLIKSSLNFLQACQELSINEKLCISRKAWDYVYYEYYEELDDCCYDDEGKKFLSFDDDDKNFCTFYDDDKPSLNGLNLKITDVLAQDWEVWNREY